MGYEYIIYYIIFCYAFSLGCVACEGAKGEQVVMLIFAPIALPFLFLLKLYKAVTNK